MINLNQLRSQYYETVLSVDTLEEMKSILPHSLSSNFGTVLSGVIELLSKEIEEYLDVLNDETDEEYKQFCYEEINALRRKIEMCQIIIDDAIVKTEDKVDLDKKTTIIFGVNSAGNVAFFNDVKRDIDDHYYPTILELLDQLESGEITHNPEKSVRFNSNNAKLQGLMEVKGYQVRLLYRLLPDNMVYVEMVRIKKDDRSTRDYEEPIKRTSLLGKDYERVRSRIKDKVDVDEIIITSQETLREIREYITSRMKKEVK